MATAIWKPLHEASRRSSCAGIRTCSETPRPTSAGDVRLRWERIKREQEGREGIFHDLPAALPALHHARKAQRRAASVGFEYPDLDGALADLDDELAELRHELTGGSGGRQAEELGDVLFACVNVARHLDVDPELELRRASGRFVARVEEAARLAGQAGDDWARLPLAEQDRYFDLAKEQPLPGSPEVVRENPTPEGTESNEPQSSNHCPPVGRAMA